MAEQAPSDPMAGARALIEADKQARGQAFDVALADLCRIHRCSLTARTRSVDAAGGRTIVVAEIVIAPAD